MRKPKVDVHFYAGNCWSGWMKAVEVVYAWWYSAESRTWTQDNGTLCARNIRETLHLASECCSHRTSVVLFRRTLCRSSVLGTLGLRTSYGCSVFWYCIRVVVLDNTLRRAERLLTTWFNFVGTLAEFYLHSQQVCVCLVLKDISGN